MEFDIDRTVKYWLSGARYDIKTAVTLLIGKRYPYALFFGHLALEKVLKALVVKETNKHAPHTHSLPLLASKLSREIPENVKKQLAAFMEFYIEGRYPEERNKFYRKCTKNFTQQKLDEIREVFKWLARQL